MIVEWKVHTAIDRGSIGEENSRTQREVQTAEEDVHGKEMTRWTKSSGSNGSMGQVSKSRGEGDGTRG